MPAHATPWSRIDAADVAALTLVRETLEAYPMCPGAAGFAVREDEEMRVYLTPPAALLLGSSGFPADRLAPSGPPQDGPYLRLIGGDRRAWTAVVRSGMGADAVSEA